MGNPGWCYRKGAWAKTLIALLEGLGRPSLFAHWDQIVPPRIAGRLGDLAPGRDGTSTEASDSPAGRRLVDR